MERRHQVIVRNSCIEVKNYEKGDSEQLEKNFSVYDPMTHRFSIMGMYIDKKSKTLYLPRGIDIWYVKKVLDEHDHEVLSPNESKKFEKNALLKYKPRDQEQFQALNYMCGLTEEYEENLHLPQLQLKNQLRKRLRHRRQAIIPNSDLKTAFLHPDLLKSGLRKMKCHRISLQ